MDPSDPGLAGYGDLLGSLDSFGRGYQQGVTAGERRAQQHTPSATSSPPAQPTVITVVLKDRNLLLFLGLLVGLLLGVLLAKYIPLGP
jgi:hypothetical protein